MFVCFRSTLLLNCNTDILLILGVKVGNLWIFKIMITRGYSLLFGALHEDKILTPSHKPVIYTPLIGAFPWWTWGGKEIYSDRFVLGLSSERKQVALHCNNLLPREIPQRMCLWDKSQAYDNFTMPLYYFFYKSFMLNFLQPSDLFCHLSALLPTVLFLLK